MAAPSVFGCVGTIFFAPVTQLAKAAVVGDVGLCPE